MKNQKTVEIVMYFITFALTIAGLIVTGVLYFECINQDMSAESGLALAIWDIEKELYTTLFVIFILVGTGMFFGIKIIFHSTNKMQRILGLSRVVLAILFFLLFGFRFFVNHLWVLFTLMIVFVLFAIVWIIECFQKKCFPNKRQK
ncbi:MAG: hypothetical protein K6F14_05525 [Clostridiales bacterium]|nr:hypothetical protein [Clostridiales bacterium]